MKTLYLFTNSFPYSTPESFLEEEIIFLSKRFDKIVIMPFTSDTKRERPVPENCEVINIPLSNKRLKYTLLGLFHYKTVWVLTKEFFRNRVFTSLKKIKAWIWSARCLNNCLYNRRLQKVLKNVSRNDVCYFYWGIGQCLLSIVLKGKTHLVSRFHGEWDLWEESYGGFHSLRTEVAHSLDKAVFIAKKGELYFKERYPFAKTVVFPLGTKDNGVQLKSPADGIIRVVSCSKIYPLKRVPLIFEAINSLTDYRIEWTHIGDGPDYNLLKQKVASESRDHLKVLFLGYMTNKDILEYYSSHHFDMFINMSTSEGVPVSIMEASSFGIPIIATNVGSTSEEVPSQVGELISPNPSLSEITEAIRKVLSTNYSPREFWLENYNADKNYAAFADLLYQL